jgi:hypothetical protein
MLWLAGWFDTTIRESYDAHQSEFDYAFDSTKFMEAFHFQ